jgi:2-dehydro-3-deoxyphosphooctonate aldolase (KDO 8-P synthase)
MEQQPSITPVTIAPNVTIGGNQPVFIMGPCAIESRDHCLFMADAVKQRADKFNIPVIFKASFDKANRTSLESYRGPGLEEGLAILQAAKDATGLPITSDVHTPDQVPSAAEVLDLIQIPAFLCRQTDFIVATAQSDKPVSIKKGQFLAPWDMQHVVNKYHGAGGTKLVLIERGSSFGYNNLVSDMRSLPIMRAMGVPVIYDGTHSVQMPGGQGKTSGGNGHLAPALMRAAMAVGCDGIFMEVHDNPSQAKSDGPNMVPLEKLDDILRQLLAIKNALQAIS